MLGTWFYEHPYFTDRDVLLFRFLLTNKERETWIKAADKCPQCNVNVIIGLLFSFFRRVLLLQRRQVLGQFDGLVVEAVELLHDEVEVGGEVRLCAEAPDQGGEGHEGGQQQQDVREKLGRGRREE